MSKLFKLKEWVTLSEAKTRLSTTLKESVTEADLLRLALDRRLQLSVHFVNHAMAIRGSIEVPENARYATSLDGHSQVRLGIQLDNGDVIAMEKEVIKLTGVFDLAMIGGEQLDIEQKFQELTSGPEVTLIGSDGVFVIAGSKYFQLQEDIEDNEFQDGSLASLGRLRSLILSKNLNEQKANDLLNYHKEDRENLLADIKSSPFLRYFPAAHLPDDAVLVIRTGALIDFEKSLEEKSDDAEKPLKVRQETTYLNIIAALLVFIKEPRPGRNSEAQIITELVENYREKKGISLRTLQEKFADAKRSFEDD